MGKMNIIITGIGAHGKDTVCDMLAGSFTAISSSWAACESAVFPALKDIYGYDSPFML